MVTVKYDNVYLTGNIATLFFYKKSKYRIMIYHTKTLPVVSCGCEFGHSVSEKNCTIESLKDYFNTIKSSFSFSSLYFRHSHIKDQVTRI
jgi:hypothetical protein